MQESLELGSFQVSAFYLFTRIENPTALKTALEVTLRETAILGTVLLAQEGVNGTISGPSNEVEHFLRDLAQRIGVDRIPYKVASASYRPFHRMKVRIKKEIVTLGVDGIDPTRNVGTYVAPEKWNELISRDDVVLIDTRNDYEYTVGSFAGAVNPMTRSFREFPEYVAANLNPEKTPKVAMFCTGGIRCEKASALMLEKGFKEVYHLEGGILEYFNRVPVDQSRWQGECFVFDERVTVDQNLKPGTYVMCHACRMPLNPSDLNSSYYAEGISCPHCYETLTEEKKNRLEQRNLQMKLARERNEGHIGKRHTRHQVSLTSDVE